MIMVGNLLFLVLVVGVGIAIASARSTHRTATSGAAPVAHDARPASPPPDPAVAHQRSMATITEALGYLGGILAIVGMTMFVGAQWGDLGTPARLAISGIGAVLLVLIGALVHADADPAYFRLRSFVWLLSTAATAVFAGVAADGAGASTAWIAAAASGAVAVESAALWQWRERPVQQLTALAGLAVFADVVVTTWLNEELGGLALWAVGAALVVVGVAHLTPTPVVTVFVGAVAALIGPTATIDEHTNVGSLWMLGTAAALITLPFVRGLVRTRPERVVLGVLASVFIVQAFGATVAYWSNGAGIATGLAVWATGIGLVLAGRHPRVEWPIVPTVVGGLMIVGGAALTGQQSPAFATLFGIVTAVGLLAVGTRRDMALMSVFGSLGLLVFVPWAIGWFFPGEGRAPLLIMVSGAVILGVAFLLARRFRRPGPPEGEPVTGQPVTGEPVSEDLDEFLL